MSGRSSNCTDMDVVKLALLCVAVALLCATLRVEKPEMAMALSLAAGAMALIWALPYVRDVVEQVTALATGAGLTDASMTMMLRAVGIAIVTEFSAQLCRDAGEGALAGRVEFGGKAALLSMSVPLVTGIVARLTALLP